MKHALRVYYEDTDAGGVVYYANYFKFAERARTEWLRVSGHDHASLRDTFGILFVVRRAFADFYRPARLDDLLTVETRLTERRGTRFSLSQAILRGDEELVRIGVEIACVGADFRPARLPEALRALFVQPER